MNLLNLNHATKNNYHLSNLIEDLPQNCFFNKVLYKTHKTVKSGINGYLIIDI